jgi:hypothetical protein
LRARAAFFDFVTRSIKKTLVDDWLRQDASFYGTLLATSMSIAYFLLGFGLGIGPGIVQSGTLLLPHLLIFRSPTSTVRPFPGCFALYFWGKLRVRQLSLLRGGLLAEAKLFLGFLFEG